MPRAISKAIWDQIKIARAAGGSYGEIAERTGISKGSISPAATGILRLDVVDIAIGPKANYAKPILLQLPHKSRKGAIDQYVIVAKDQDIAAAGQIEALRDIGV